MTSTKTPISQTELLQWLEATSPGLSVKPGVDQGESYCFRNGWLTTFDGEMMCKCPTTLPPTLKASVPGKSLLEAIRKIDVKEVEVAVEGSEFIVSSKRDEVRMRCNPNITLPVETVEKPEVWTPLPQEFSEALEMACECVGKDNAKFLITCVHLTPKHIEATDRFSYMRYRLKSGAPENMLIRAKWFKQVAARGPTKVAYTKSWAHFKNASGLRISIRRHDPYQHGGEKLAGFDEVVTNRGEPAGFPKSLVTAAKLAEIFSGENTENNFLTVTMGNGIVRITGEGATGKATHKAKIKYDGPPLTFTVGPKVLSAMIDKYNDIEVTPGHLIVNSDKWYYTTSLNEIGANNGTGASRQEGS